MTPSRGGYRGPPPAQGVPPASIPRQATTGGRHGAQGGRSRTGPRPPAQGHAADGQQSRPGQTNRPAAGGPWEGGNGAEVGRPGPRGGHGGIITGAARAAPLGPRPGGRGLAAARVGKTRNRAFAGGGGSFSGRHGRRDRWEERRGPAIRRPCCGGEGGERCGATPPQLSPPIGSERSERTTAPQAEGGKAGGLMGGRLGGEAQQARHPAKRAHDIIDTIAEAPRMVRR